MNWMIVLAIALTIAGFIVNLRLVKAMEQEGHSNLLDIAYAMLWASVRAAVVALTWHIAGAVAVVVVFVVCVVLILPWVVASKQPKANTGTTAV